MARGTQGKNGNGTANLGFEQKLWLAADKLRGSMNVADYKHTVLGLIFLKYISDSFETRRSWLVRETVDPKSQYHVKGEAQMSGVEDALRQKVRHALVIGDAGFAVNLRVERGRCRRKRGRPAKVV